MRLILEEKGVSLIVVILLVLVLGVVSATMVSLVNTESFNAMNQSSSSQAFYLAEAGIEKALYQLNTGMGCSALSVTNNLGSGSFINTGTQYNPNPLTTLSAALPNSTATTTIQVVNNTNYASHGMIQVDSELINYTGKSGATQLTGARRGVNGTTVAAHAIGATVLQGECLIRSTGTVANPIPGIGATQRVIEVTKVASSKQGQFTKRIGTGSQSIAGVGFQPKALIFFWTEQTGVGFTNYVNAGVGFATGPANERGVSITARDNQTRSDNGRMYSESYPIIFLTGGGPPTNPPIARAQLTSLDPDGFTLNWTISDGNQYIIHYIALGGDITNALAGTFNLSTAGGNQSVTGVGFQPDFVMFLWSYTGAFDSALASAEMGLGFAKSNAARAALVYTGSDGTRSNANKRWQQRTDSALLLIDPTNNPPNQEAVANLVSMNADGFTINKSVSPAATTPIFFLALKGGNHQVGSFNQRTGTTGNQSITGIGFRPQQLMLASFNLAATNAISSLGAISYGAAQFPNPNQKGSIWYQDRSDRDPSEANVYTSTTDILTLATGPTTVNARADFTSFDLDGFTLNWTTVDATARQILYWAIGPTANNGEVDWQEVY